MFETDLMPDEPRKMSLASLWQDLCVKRDPFLQRARECAALTIPNLFPPEGASTYYNFTTPYQSLGARGSNNLAAKFLLTLFPPNSPFFRLKLEVEVEEALESLDEKGVRETEESLAKIERQVNEYIESTGMRVVFFEAIKHLIVAGNSLIHIPDDGGIRLFRLDQYCVVRDSLSNVCEILTKECIAKNALAPDLQKIAKEQVGFKDKDEIELWTHVIRVDSEWYETYQTIGDVEIEGSFGKVKASELPWIPLRLSSVAGESYGRGFVEEYKGDLRSLEALTKAIVQGSAAAARLVMMIRPNSATKAADISKAENGDVIKGNMEDVGFLQVNKFNDFRVAAETAKNIESRLAAAFLLNSSIQRDAERVTAEEVRYMAQELESALGGVYSVLGQEFQLPLLNRILALLKAKGTMSRLPKRGLRPVVITGVEALGRGHDMNRLQIYFQTLANNFGPEFIKQRINGVEAASRLASALGIDDKNLFVSDEELAAQSQQTTMNDAMLKAVGPVAGKLAGGMVSPQPNGAEAPQ